MKFAKIVRDAIVQKNITLGIAMDATKSTELGQSLDRFLDQDGEIKSDKSENQNDSENSKRFSFSDKARFQASYLDIFVEDAICHLTARASSFYRSAIACIMLAGFILVMGVLVVLRSSQNIPENLDITHLVIRIFSSLAIAGLVLVAAKGILSLIRAFLHEATRLLERRHALRFGKLFFYLKLGHNNDSIDLTLENIQEAFQWNKETSTAFLDMKPEVIADTIINQMARMPASAIEKGFEKYHKTKKKDLDKK